MVGQEAASFSLSLVFVLKHQWDNLKLSSNLVYLWGQSGSSAMLVTESLAGVTPEMNPRNPPCTDDKACN